MNGRHANGHACENEEQGVTGASLQLALPLAHCVRDGKDSGGGGSVNVRRTHCVSTRVNEEELGRLKADARALHQRMGALLRACYFDGGALHVPAVNVEKWQALAVVLEDLQRLALGLNSGQLPGDVRPVLTATMEGIHELRGALVGQAAAKGEGGES